MVLRHPQTRAYQPDRASRTACRTATHPADHTPRNPTRESEKFMPSPLTNVSPYQLGALMSDSGRTTHTGLDPAFYVTRGTPKRLGFSEQAVPVVIGEDVRD